MGAMKRANYLATHTPKSKLSYAFRVAFGIDPEPPSYEELAAIRARNADLRAALREAAEEAKAEREAIQWVERQASPRAAAPPITRLQPPPIPTENTLVHQPTLF